MKKPIIASVVALALGAGAFTVLAQDPHVVGPDIYKTKLQNERVRVYEITFKPGASIKPHRHPDHVVYVLTAGTLSIQEGNKAPVTMNGKAGDTFFLPAQTHSAKNIGKTTMKALVVEIR
ncbi:MAG TPA: cupin domain-containing protein [Fimbriimonadaceae bacterium]|nr:cupin domain-containing protein [Fimbriimonadaceae bacterium]